MTSPTPQALSFGDLLRMYRVAARLTQDELARKAGVSSRAVSALERGVNKRPQRYTVEALAAALGLDDAQRERFIRARSMAIRQTPLLRATSLAPAASPHAATPLIGREREQARIAGWLASDGTPFLLLVGRPGIGKTRLLNDVVERAARAGWIIVRGSSHASDGQRAYAPLTQAMEAALAAIPAAERGALLKDCDWLARLLPQWVDSDALLTRAWDLPPERERQLMFDAAARFLNRLAEPNGALLALDDLQWATPDGLALLAALARSVSTRDGRGLRIMAAIRESQPDQPGGQPSANVGLAALERDGLVESLRLGPLDDEDAAALLRMTLPIASDETPGEREALLQQIVAQAGGAPLNLLSLAQEAGGRRSAAPDARAISMDIVNLVQRRVSQLPGAASDALAIIAVYNNETPLSLLVAASDHTEPQMIAAVEAACAVRLLIETPEASCAFTHDLYRDAILATLSESRRRALHRRIATALEADPRRAQIAPLAFHYAQSADAGRALHFLERAGDEALAVRAYAAADACYRDALARVGGSDDPGAAGRLWDKLGALYMGRGQYTESLAALNSAVAFYESAGDLNGAGMAVFQICWAHVKRGTGDQGLPRIQSWLEPEAMAGLAPLTRAALWRAHAILLFGQNRYSEQLASARRAASIARELNAADATSALAQALRLEGLALTLLGWFDEALPALRETLRLAEIVGDLDSYSAALNDTAAVYRARGELCASKESSAQSVAVADMMGDPTAMAFLTASYGDDCYYLGDWARARTQYERALAVAREIGASWVAAYPLFSLGQLNLVEGREAVAVGMLTEALAHAARDGDRQAIQSVRLALAGRDLARGEAALALARLEPLLDPATSAERDLIELAPLVGWALLDLGDHGGALAWIQRGRELAEARGSYLILGDALVALARARIRQAEWVAAEHTLDEALRRARAMAYPYAEARALSVYGELWAARGAQTQARAHFDRALAICARLGERPYRARIEGLIAGL